MTLTTPAHELLRRARQALPDGSLNAWAMPDEAACVITSGAGSHVYDADGREYVDFVSGSGPGILGHAHPAVVAAVQDQVAKGSQFYALTEPTIELAETLISAIPCAEMIKFTSTGAEATFQALRLARAYTGREKIMRFAASYHGHHDYSQFGLSEGIPAAIGDLVVTATFNDLDDTAMLIERHGAELAAVIVEPFQRVTPPRDGFLSGLRRLTAERGILLVFDEVVTGFRLAWGGAQERYGVVPDLASYGKIIGGGLPLGAVVGPGELIERASPHRSRGESVAVSGTLNGNPLAAAAGLATLNTLRQAGTYDNLARTGESLCKRLNDAAAASPLSLQTLGDPVMIGLCFGEGDPYDPATQQRGDAMLRSKLEVELFRRGVFANVAAKLYVTTQHDETDIGRTVEAFAQSLEVLSRQQ